MKLLFVDRAYTVARRSARFHVMASRRRQRSHPPDGGYCFGGLRPPRGDIKRGRA